MVRMNDIGMSDLWRDLEGVAAWFARIRERDAVQKAFRKEFLNRLDETIIFHRLDRAQLRSIVDVQLGNFEKRLAERDLRFEITDAAKDFLANVGYDPTYGARPLKRAIQRYLENGLAEDILSGRFTAGYSIRVEAGEGKLVFERAGLASGDETRINA